MARLISSTLIIMKIVCVPIQKVLGKIAFFTVVFCVFLFMIKHVKYRRRVQELRRRQFEEIPRPRFYHVAQNYERKDWHDSELLKQEEARLGDGEKGKAFVLSNAEDEELIDSFGLNALASDKVSVNRSLPDTRRAECRKIKYFKTLPTVSAVIAFHNEHLSVLLRTIHSIINRAPRELLREVLLVNDASTEKDLQEKLEDYAKLHFNGRVKLINLKTKLGPIAAQVEGARRASGDVLMFLNSFMEVNTNFLPPLLEPIAIEPRTVTTPANDSINWDTFEYKKLHDNTRVLFDLDLKLRRISRRSQDQMFPEKPAQVPVLLGDAFAIRKDVFFDIGGFDEGMKVSGGENIELSLKVWLSGGQILEVPCSRVGQGQRLHDLYRTKEFEGFNLKRIAEVWLGSYKKILYQKNHETFDKIDRGDLSKAKKLRTRLNCKPFDFFLEQVMPDMEDRFPWYDRLTFGSGAVQNIAARSMCLDADATREGLGIKRCDRNLTHPPWSQDFLLSYHRQLMLNNDDNECVDGQALELQDCHFNFGFQLWYYDISSLQLANIKTGKCLTANIRSGSIESATCEPKNFAQKWRFGYVNRTAIQNWIELGVRLPNL